MMKFKALCLVGFLSLFSTAFAANQHLHPQAADTKAKNNQLARPGECQIEIINQSYSDVHVTGVYDDGTPMQPFNVYSYESPQYISLLYYGYCHAGMDLDIDTFYGYHLFGGYAHVQSTIRIVPYWNNKVKVEVQMK